MLAKKNKEHLKGKRYIEYISFCSVGIMLSNHLFYSSFDLKMSFFFIIIDFEAYQC